MAKLRSSQNGAAMMVFAAILAVGGSWWLMNYATANMNVRAVDSREHNARVLNLAKQALIGYVAYRVNHPDSPFAAREKHPGRLPCPEAPGNIGGASEGQAASVCTLPAVGRLPWKTLGIDQLRDAHGEPLWYVVSEGWTLPFSTAPLSLNSNTRGELTVDGQANAAAALLIAPGPPLSVQASANCTAFPQARAVPAPSIDYRNYLECQNATSPADATFATAGPGGSFNDQVLMVSSADVWSIVEGAVAARLERDVMATLRAAFAAPYATGQWGAGPTTPILPFALSFADDSTQPRQGSLPLLRSQGCTAGTDPLCDPDFVHWAINDPDQATYPNPSMVKRVFGNDTANISGTPDCVGSSSSQQVSCTLSYGGSCGGGLNLGYVLGGRCWLDLEVSVLARAKNIGRALRAFDTAPISVSESPWSVASYATPIGSDATGAVAADIRIQLPPASCNCPALLCLLFPCTASSTVTVTVPIAVFPDHPALTALFAPGGDPEWFVENKWYEAMYYAVAPRHAPDGSPHDCRTAAPDCLTVSGGNLPADVRALVGMTGYSRDNRARPNTDFTDYLDSAENRNGDPAFEQKTAGRSFNDRFFSVSAY